MEGQGDLVSRLIMGIIGVTIWVIGAIILLTKVPLTLQVGVILGLYRGPIPLNGV